MVAAKMRPGPTRQLRAGQHGIFGEADAARQAAAVAAMQAAVGSAYGGRPLQRLGGTFDPADYGSAPAPAQANMRSTAAPQGCMRTENPLDTINRGQR